MKQHLNHTLTLVALAIMLVVSCKKEASVPTVTTAEVTEITQNTATSGGTITSNGGSDVKSYGVCWSTSPNPTVKDSTKSQYTGFFIIPITGLTANTNYHLRAYATNSAGTGYGNTVTFNTLSAVLPTVRSAYPASVTQTTAQLGGEVTSDGGAPVTARGVCWSTGTNPTIANSKTADGKGVGTFTSTLTGLTPSTTYYLRVYATNVVGTAYGSTLEMRTLHSTLTDIDGNVYQTVLIGTQEWIAENLKVTRYRNGDAIPNITDNTQWFNTTLGAWCSYNNDPANKTTYGLLYNHYTIDDSRGICPSGWHVPSDSEWTTLTSYLGGENVAGFKLKKTGYAIVGDNSSGFSALQGGWRANSFDGFADFDIGLWWSASIEYTNSFHARYIGRYEKGIHRHGYDVHSGLSIRCLKDN